MVLLIGHHHLDRPDLLARLLLIDRRWQALGRLMWRLYLEVVLSLLFDLEVFVNLYLVLAHATAPLLVGTKLYELGHGLLIVTTNLRAII